MVIAALAAFAALCATRPAPAQIWLVGMSDWSGVRYAALDTGNPPHHATERSYYRARRFVPLAPIVQETGTDTRAAWRARLSQDVRKIGVAGKLPPTEKREDQFNAEYQRWHNDPTHW